MQKTQQVRLYDLKHDIGEQNDLAQKYPRKAKQLAQLLTKKLKQAHAQMPVVSSTGKKVPWPDELFTGPFLKKNS